MGPRARAGCIGLLALIAAWSGLGCAGPSPATRRAATPAAGHFPTRGVPGVRLDRRRGVLLASHWLGPGGSVVDRLPQGVVRWPPALSRAAAVVRVSTLKPPTRVELRIFRGRPGPSGAPERAGERLSCERGAGRATGCVYAPTRHGVAVRLPTRHGPRLLVLYCEWYVPVPERPAAARENPVVSASWGFRLI
jgi:hypothetical protein